MSCRPKAMAKHRTERGNRQAWIQWQNQNKNNPRIQAKPTVQDAILLILHEAKEPMSKARLTFQVMFMAKLGLIRGPKPTIKELDDAAVALGKEVLHGSD